MAKAKGPFKPKEAVTPETKPVVIAIPDVQATTTTKAFSIEKDVKGQWSFVTYFFEGDNFLKKETVGPTMRAICIDEFKITAQQYIENIA